MADAPIEFSVRYRLAEYLAFVTEHAFATEPSVRCLTGARRRLTRAGMVVVAAALFLWKSLRVGQCDFRIDSKGVHRRSKGGEGVVPWSRIQSVHAYTPGYLIETHSGAMPVPFRVLGGEQRRAFERLARQGTHKAAPR